MIDGGGEQAGMASGAAASLQRLRGVYLRHYYLWKRNPEYFFDTFWQPVVDVLIWGFISYYLSRTGAELGALTSFFLGGIVLFAVLRRGQHEVTFSFMEEAWSRNLQNIMMTPVSMAEYFAASIAFGMLKLFFELGLMAGLLGLMFGFNIFTMGVAIVPFGLNLLVTGWALGLLVNAAIIYFGRGLVALSWILVFVLQPFSCVFYPVSALPGWARPIAMSFPSTWIFEGMRAVLSGQGFPWQPLGIAVALNAFFLFAAYAVFLRVMSIALDRGLLNRLEW
jgi:ABC-2 type transport system permease protein